MGYELSADLVLRAYRQGIFPMGSKDEISWYSPDPRFILDLENFHIPKRLIRKYQQGVFEIRINHAWFEVLRLCANRPNTWINSSIIRVYTELHDRGFAHSVEAYQDSKLVGGLYGVSIGGAFMGESMFHLVNDASKVCLVYLVERLRKRGFVLLDSQYETNHLNKFGGKLISRSGYLEQLERALQLNCMFT